MRDRPTIPAGTFVYEDADLASGWHSHDLHQIEYALEGIAEVETADTRYLLPPHQAMCTTLTRECLHHPAPLALPTTTDPLVREIMAATRADLGASSVQIAAVVGVSERTLRRRFVAVTDMTWSQYLLASRVLQGIALLVEQDRTITEIAFAVGFDSTSAFHTRLPPVHRRDPDAVPSDARRAVNTRLPDAGPGRTCLTAPEPGREARGGR